MLLDGPTLVMFYATGHALIALDASGSAPVPCVADGAEKDRQAGGREGGRLPPSTPGYWPHPGIWKAPIRVR